MEISRGDVVLVDLGREENSSVQGGRRPCVVISNNVINAGDIVTIAPISSKYEKAQKKKLKVQVLLPDQLPEPSVVLLEQSRSISKFRIIKKLQALDDITMEKIFLAYCYSSASDEAIPTFTSLIDNIR